MPRKEIHIHIHKKPTRDNWNEADHPRADNGQFGKGGGGAAPAAKSAKPPATKKAVASTSLPAHKIKSAGKLPNGQPAFGSLEVGGKTFEWDADVDGSVRIGARKFSSMNAAVQALGKPDKPATAGQMHFERKPAPAAKTPTPRIDPKKLQPGQALWDKNGVKVDEIESVSKGRLGSTAHVIHTRAGYDVPIKADGDNEKGWSTERPTGAPTTKPSPTYANKMHPDTNKHKAVYKETMAEFSTVSQVEEYVDELQRNEHKSGVKFKPGESEGLQLAAAERIKEINAQPRKQADPSWHPQGSSAPKKSPSEQPRKTVNVGTAKWPFLALSGSKLDKPDGDLTHQVPGFKDPQSPGGDAHVEMDGESFTYSGKHGTHMKTGLPSFEFRNGKGSHLWVLKDGRAMYD